ncbi:hypothetical protein SOVF_138050 isoform C [Spinacia oleracea]|nr:hypothetical protein SOVF_138050 isoform C [Spinacia oleracea]
MLLATTLTPTSYNRFWWSLLVRVDWSEVVGCTQSAPGDGIGMELYLF